MTIPSSGAISLLDIQNEFGGSSPISLNEYYAGGSYVPSGTTGTYGAVPSSGAISLRDFYGTSKIVVVNRTVTVGDKSDAFITLVGYGNSSAPAGAYGSIDNSAFGLTSATVVEIAWSADNIGNTNLVFRLGGSQPNSGFSKITIGSTDYARTSASYSSGSSYTSWFWAGVSNPFGATGSTKAVSYTS